MILGRMCINWRCVGQFRLWVIVLRVVVKRDGGTVIGINGFFPYFGRFISGLVVVLLQ